MPVPTDPVLLILTALALWGFLAACVLRDKTAGDDGPRRDPMPSVVAGAAVRSSDALSASVPLATGPVPQQPARSGRVSLDRAGLEWPSSLRPCCSGSAGDNCPCLCHVVERVNSTPGGES